MPSTLLPGGLEGNTYDELASGNYSDLATHNYAGPAIIRQVSLSVTFAGVALSDVIQARGEVSADSGWPNCSVFVTAKPATGNEEDDISVVAGAGNNVTRFTGKVRRFRPSGFPKSIEMVCSGTLAYAAEWVPPEDIYFDLVWPLGATDQQLVQWALDQVPGVSYSAPNIAGTGTILGTAKGVHTAFDWPGSASSVSKTYNWKPGMSAWAYIQQLDRATLYRTYQARDGTIYRVQMIGHPDNTPDFTLAPSDILDGSSGSRDTERTRNYVVVQGHDYGDGLGPVQGNAFGSNDFQGDGSVPSQRHTESFQAEMIESGVDPETGVWDSNPGLRADQIAALVLPDVDKEFVEASTPSWRDDTHGPGLTCLLDCLDRLAIGEPMWVARHAWEVGDQGWIATYGLTGGGLPQTYTPPPV
ncbi:MAG TPA: hypothetical protein VFB50_05925 [Chloroflexota bacterium]|nr:hypothetical protein [Chloroflexota bacterium]